MISKDEILSVLAKVEVVISNRDREHTKYARECLRRDIPDIIWMAENGHFDEFPGRIEYLASEGFLTLEGGGAAASPTDVTDLTGRRLSKMFAESERMSRQVKQLVHDSRGPADHIGSLPEMIKIAEGMGISVSEEVLETIFSDCDGVLPRIMQSFEDFGFI